MPRLLRKSYLYVITQDLSRLVELAGRPPEGVRVFFTSRDDDLRAIDEVAVRDGYPSRFETMREHLSAGGRIAVAAYGDVPVAWLMHRRSCQDTYRWLRLIGDDRSVFGYGLYTVRDWRRRGIARLLDGYCAQAYLDEGCVFNCAVMEPGASSSRHYHVRTEHRIVGFIRRVRVAGGLTVVHSDQNTRIGRFDAARPYVYTMPYAREDGSHP